MLPARLLFAVCSLSLVAYAAPVPGDADAGGAATKPTTRVTFIMGPRVMPPLNPDDLISPSGETRLKAIRILRQDDPKLRAYDDVLLKAATQDTDPLVRAEAVAVLGAVYSRTSKDNPAVGLKLPSASVFDAIIKSLGDADIGVDGAAARALVAFGARAAAAAPKLRAMLEDPKFGAIDLSLGEALLAVDPSGDAIKSFLQGNAGSFAKAAAIEAFSLNRNKAHVPLVAGFLSDDEPRLRAAAVLTLARMHVTDSDVVAKIVSLAGDPDAEVRAGVVRSLLILGTKDQARDVAAKLSNDPSPKVKAALVMLNHRLNPKSTQPSSKPADAPAARN